MVVMVTLAGGSVVLVHEYSELLEIQFVVPVIIPLLNQPAYAQLPARNMLVCGLELKTKVGEDYAKLYHHGEGPSSGPSSNFTFKTLLRHYAKLTLTSWKCK